MGRDWRVDTLRGYFLVAMTLAHFPNPLARFTEYTFGYASSPDGFIFLSGLVSAWVYLPLGQRSGSSAMVTKIFYRTRTIYLTHMGLLVLGILGAYYAGIGRFTPGKHSSTGLYCGIKSASTEFCRCIAYFWHSAPSSCSNSRKGALGSSEGSARACGRVRSSDLETQGR